MPRNKKLEVIARLIDLFVALRDMDEDLFVHDFPDDEYMAYCVERDGKTVHALMVWYAATAG